MLTSGLKPYTKFLMELEEVYKNALSPFTNESESKETGYSF